MLAKTAAIISMKSVYLPKTELNKSITQLGRTLTKTFDKYLPQCNISFHLVICSRAENKTTKSNQIVNSGEGERHE